MDFPGVAKNVFGEGAKRQNFILTTRN